MQNKRNSFLILSFPFLVFVLLGLVLFVERTGVIYSKQILQMEVLSDKDIPQQSTYTDAPAQCLLLINTSEQKDVFYANLEETMKSMRVKCDTIDTSPLDAGEAYKKYNFESYQTVVVAIRRINSTELYDDLMNWNLAGGKVLFASPQKVTAGFQKYMTAMGIKSATDEVLNVKGIKFLTDLLPGSEGLILSDNTTFSHNSMSVILNTNAKVHLTSADEFNLPILWEASAGAGRIVFINSVAFQNKPSRGMVAAAYSLLQDKFVYPVINSSMFFVDDLPAQIQEGQAPEFKKEFNMNNRDFLVDVWWPQMDALGRDYGIKYSGAVMETLDFNTQPPFERFSNLDDFRWMGGNLLKGGGQIGLLGYNHLPLCMEADGANQSINLPSWPSIEAMKGAINELNNFLHLVYPDRKFTLYVAPSNMICPDMRQELPKLLPDLKVIASAYSPVTDQNLYVQEFEEAADGIIEMPRIVYGYRMSDYAKWAIINELGLHYVSSQSVQATEVLFDMRQENKTWKELRDGLEAHIQWLFSSAPMLRSFVAQDGAAAIQRYSRLQVNSQIDSQGNYHISLGNFYDEAWLMLRSSTPPTSIEGGTFTKVTSTLYLIQASSPEIVIRY